MFFNDEVDADNTVSDETPTTDETPVAAPADADGQEPEATPEA